MDSKVLGIVGGGQLGRMTVEAANRLNVRTLILDAENAPAKQINNDPEHVTGKFTDAVKVKELAGKCDELTIEIEHVDADALAECGKPVSPEPRTIKLIQDKYLQKEHLVANKIPTALSESVEATVESCAAFGDKHGYPFMLKSRKDAYDGKGNSVVRSSDKIADSLAELPSSGFLYAEKWQPFVAELAVMVVRLKNGEVVTYPCVETYHENNVCHTVFAPASFPAHILKKAETLARDAVATLWGSGVFGVEMFLLADDSLLINEIAPRPHNSGHYTQDACVTSQFEAHVRACVGLPLPASATTFSTPDTNCIMLNVLGKPEGKEIEQCQRALLVPGCAVHLYGKETRVGRKLGHINIVGSSMAECKAKLAFIEHNQPLKPVPEVGVIMGSDSDLNVMKNACAILEQFGVPFEVDICSAHRTPVKMVEYAESAASRGIKVIIAGAGGAAHLPGMVAASTELPVIGVPVKGSSLDGVDSLYSIVQMPRGVPVATVAINNAMNAGLLAIRILGASNSELRGKLNQFRETNREEVYRKSEKLGQGWKEYSWP